MVREQVAILDDEPALLRTPIHRFVYEVETGRLRPSHERMTAAEGGTDRYGRAEVAARSATTVAFVDQLCELGMLTPSAGG